MTKGYEQRKEANKRYLSTLDNVALRLPKGQKETIRAHAEQQGESVNAFIIRAINSTIAADQHRDQAEAARADDPATWPSRIIK